MEKIEITPQEVIKHLVNTGPLWDKKRYKVQFKKDGTFLVTSPDGEKEVVSSARLLSNKDWYTKPHWTGNLSDEKPVLCWVGLPAGFQVALIKGTDSGLYVCRSNNKWANAEPVKLSEACIWEEGNVN